MPGPSFTRATEGSQGRGPVSDGPFSGCDLLHPLGERGGPPVCIGRVRGFLQFAGVRGGPTWRARISSPYQVSRSPGRGHVETQVPFCGIWGTKAVPTVGSGFLG